MTEFQRNMLILAAIAVAGAIFTGAFSVTAGFAGMALNIAFTIAIVWFLVVLYQRHQGTIAQMAPTPRLVLQASGVMLLLLILSGTIALLVTLPVNIRAPMFYWPAILLSAFGIWWAWQQRASRW